MDQGTSSTNPLMVGKNMRYRVLVVDDDMTCLVIIASFLKMFNYEVETTNCPLEALTILRKNPGSFDAILSDVHMPLMTGIHLQRIVEREFQLPTILMSSDDTRQVLLGSLESGAIFFISKPPSMDELSNIWQYVVSSKSRIRPHATVGTDTVPCNTTVDHNPNVETYPELIEHSNSEPKCSDHQTQKLTNVEKELNTEEKNTSSTSRKPKMVWTSALHNKFLEALDVIGLSRAVPKKILEYMNEPGLTRENIASHLQKYRIYVRRLNDSDRSRRHGLPINWNERPFRSGFSWSQFPTLANNSFLLKHPNSSILNQQQPPRGTTSNYGLLGKNNSLFNPSYINSQGLSMHNSQHNTFAPSNNNAFVQSHMNNLNTNLFQGTSNYNNLSTQPIIGNSMLNGQKRNDGDLASAAMQFLKPKGNSNFNPYGTSNPTMIPQVDPPYRQSDSFLGLAKDINFTNSVLMPNSQRQFSSQIRPYLQGSLNKRVNDTTPQIQGFMGGHQQNIVDNRFVEQPMNFQNSNYMTNLGNNIATSNQLGSMSNMKKNVHVGQPINMATNFSSVHQPISMFGKNNASIVHQPVDTSMTSVNNNMSFVTQPVVAPNMNNVSTIDSSANMPIINNISTLRDQEIASNMNNIMFTRNPSVIPSNVMENNSIFNQQISNVNNNSTQGVNVGNNANTVQSQGDHEKDLSDLDFQNALLAPQDWSTPKYLDDFSLDCGLEDLSAIFPSIDAQNENDNQFI